MSRYLELERWPRRATFDFYRAFDKPYFNVCTRLDVAPLKAALAARAAPGGLALACYFVSLKLANALEPFRYRVEGDRVRVLDVVHGSCTVLREDESFGFAYLDHAEDFDRFAVPALAAIDAARAPGARFEPRPDEQAVLHLTTLPWVHFTSFSHARNWGREDSVPKLAFGRAQAEGPHLWLPMSVEVHHGLMDGLHVGRFVEGFESMLAAPGRWLGERA